MRGGGISAELVDGLFGSEDPASFGKSPALGDLQRPRGALCFWDAYPIPQQGMLSIEVMTPRQSEYYHGAQSPHDAGEPIPVYFLALPPRTVYRFIVTHGPALTPDQLVDTRADKNQSETAALFAALKRGEWSGQTRLLAAGKVKASMQAASKWKEKSAKKNPQKDHDHQDTLLVMKWLAGE